MCDLGESTGDSDLMPDTVSYSTVIDCWAKSKQKDVAERAENMLKQMQEMHNVGNDKVKANVVTFNSVINAWSKSGAKDAPQRAEALLHQMHIGF